MEIVGISKDSVKRQNKFALKNGFEFSLLSDEEGSVIEAFGAWGRKKFMGREYDGIHRISYLLDEEGRVAAVFGKVATKTHGTDVLQAL